MVLGAIADDDSDLPGEDLRTSHANDVGLNAQHQQWHSTHIHTLFKATVPIFFIQ